MSFRKILSKFRPKPFLVVPVLYGGYKYSHMNLKDEEKPSYHYKLNFTQNMQFSFLNYFGKKPVVVALYDAPGGTTYFDKFVRKLIEEGFEVVKVTPEQGLNHPVFSTGNIHGIYLPGGPNIVDDKNPDRTTLERQLIDMARKYDIPTVGVCRGTQAIAFYFGNSVKTFGFEEEVEPKKYSESQRVRFQAKMKQHYGESTVLVTHGSQLYAALQSEFKGSDGVSPFKYEIVCMHGQHAVLDAPYNPALQVTARNPVGNIVEAVEISTGKYRIVGFQHHPEAVLEYAQEERDEQLEEVAKKSEPPYCTDPDRDTANQFVYVQAVNAVKAAEHSTKERAAQASYGLFSDQAKLKFLESMLQTEADGLKAAKKSQ